MMRAQGQAGPFCAVVGSFEKDTSISPQIENVAVVAHSAR